MEEKLVDGKYYWVRYDEKWRIAEWMEKYEQFQFHGRTVYGLSHMLEIDYKPIER